MMIMINDGDDYGKQVSNVSSISSFCRKYRYLWFMGVTSRIYDFQKYKKKDKNFSLSFLFRYFQSWPVALLSITQEFSSACRAFDMVQQTVFLQDVFLSSPDMVF